MDPVPDERVAGLSFRSLFLGGSLACGLTSGDDLLCWEDGHARPYELEGIPGVLGASLALGAGQRCGLVEGRALCLWGGETFPVRPDLRFEELDGREDRTCGLTSRGDVWCWRFGPSAGPPSAPEKLDADRPFTTVRVGWRNGCALDADGVALCWGTAHGAGADAEYGDVPTPVHSDHRFASISAAFDRACGVTRDARALCWGAGPAGDGQPDGWVSTPREVSGGERWSSVVVGPRHVCGQTLDGRILCWGELDDTGTGSSVVSRTPRRVLPGRQAQDVDLGSHVGCVVTTEHELLCWGMARADGIPGPSNWTDLCYGWPCSRTPRPVPGAPALARVWVGERHACGVTPAGTAYCWGANENGQLGDGTVGRSRAEPVPVATDLSFSEMGMGAYHTCGLTPEGEGWCWGSGYVGQLGHPTVQGSTRPVPLAPDLTVESLAVQSERSCALVDGGRVMCWGGGATGRHLGDVELTWLHGSDATLCGIHRSGAGQCWGAGATGQYCGKLCFEPSLALEGRPVREIVPGCAILASGRPECWRSPDLDEDGGRTLHDLTTSAGGVACALGGENGVWCWGDNRFGLLGTGELDRLLRPGAVADGARFAVPGG